MDNPQKLLCPRVVVQLLFFIIIEPFLPLLISWHWDWWEAWVYAMVCILGFFVSRSLAARRHPDLLVERSHSLQHADTKPWDKILSPLVGLGGGLILIVAGLDERYDWSPAFNMPLKIVALLIILAGFALGSYALIENRFFSGTVRIQNERGHQVVSSGPYSWMRHPGYAGALVTYLATPIFLDSSWAFITTLFLAVVLIIRTKLEDETLQIELTGYRDYARLVRYRLIPFIW